MTAARETFRSLPFCFLLFMPFFFLFFIRFQIEHDKYMTTAMVKPTHIRLFKTIPYMIADLIRFPLLILKRS